MTIEIGNEDGAQALDQSQLLKRAAGFGVRPTVGNGCVVTAGANLDINVAGGEIVFDGSVVSLSAQTVTLDAGDSDPRRDVIYLDTNGTAQIAKGSPAAKEPSGNAFPQIYSPAPDALEGTDAVVLAEVYVPAGASSVGSSEVRDRRLATVANDGDVVAKNVDAETLTDTALAGEIDTTQLSDDAVTAAKIAAAAVQSGQIDTGAVGSDEIATDAVSVDELASALGTTSSSRVPGTTYFDTASANTLEATTANIKKDGSAQFDSIPFLKQDGIIQGDGSTSYTYNLTDSSRRIVYLLFEEFGEAGGGGTAAVTADLRLRINGDSGANYSFTDITGSQITGSSDLPLGENNRLDRVTRDGLVRISSMGVANFHNVVNVSYGDALLTGSGYGPAIDSGVHEGSDSATNSVTIRNANGNAIGGGQIRVFVSDIPILG